MHERICNAAEWATELEGRWSKQIVPAPAETQVATCSSCSNK